MAKFSAFALFAAGALFGQSVDPKTYFAPEKDRGKLAAARMLPSLGAAMAPAAPQILDPVTESERRAIPELPGVPTAGLHRKLTLPASRTGHWEAIGSRRVWRTSIHSPGARSLRVHFSDFNAGAGRVWVHNGSAEQPEIGGPYTGLGWTGDGDFWSDIISGDTIVIEYEAASADQRAPFEVTEISHALSGIAQTEADPEGPRLAALSCHQDASCFPEWTDTGKSVARYVFEKDGGSYLCTGTLLNTRQSRSIPYFITADHCVDSDSVARTVQAFWFYQTSRCNGPAPATRDLPRSLGARYLAGGDLQQGDFTLMRLTDVPSGVIFSGWSADAVDVGTTLTGIHHPAGDFRRLSQGRSAADSTLGSGLARDRFYSVQWAAGHTEGGSSGSGLFSAPGRLVGTLYGGLRTATGVTKCDLDPDYSFYGRFATAYPTLRDFLEDRDTTTNNPGSGSSTQLTSGQPQSFKLGPVNSPTLFTGTTSMYRVTVPANATRLQIRIASATPGVDIDLYARFDQAPVLGDGRVIADHSSTGTGADETITITAQSSPALRAGNYVIAMAMFSTGVVADGTITVTIDTQQAAAQPIRLTSGQAQRFSYSPVSSSTLMNAPGSMFDIVVPQDATKLTIRLNTTATDVDVDLYARFGQAPALQGSSVLADHASEGPMGVEELVITPTSTPALRSGTYVVALAVFTAGRAIEGTVTAIVDTGTSSTPSSDRQLVSGQAQQFTIGPVASATLLNAETSLYRVVVPAGATRLTVRVTTETQGADVDLHIRYGSAPAVQGGRLVADDSSESEAGTEEITVDNSSTPVLRAGTYYVALALFTPNLTVRGQITAVVANTPASVRLTSRQPRPFRFEPVNGPTLMNAPSSLFEVEVPEGARRLQIKLNTTTPNADLDLYARFVNNPAISGGKVVADFGSESETGTELITITPSSSPPLQAGIYRIALLVFTPGFVTEGTVEAIVETTDQEPPAEPALLTSGQPLPFSLPAVTQPTLYTGVYGYRVEVPEGAARLQVRVVSNDPRVDVDLYLRAGVPVELSADGVLADFAAETDSGNETITVTGGSSPPLAPGTYYIGVVLYTTGSPAIGFVSATFERTAAPPAGGRVLNSGEAQTISIPAVSGPTLFGEDSIFRIDAPSNTSTLQVDLRTTPSSVDLDLYIRYGAPPEVRDGAVVADFRSTSAGGNEGVTIGRSSNPALRPGAYYIGFASYTRDTAASAEVKATVTAGENVPALEKSTEAVLQKNKPPVAGSCFPEKVAIQPEASPVAMPKMHVGAVVY